MTIIAAPTIETERLILRAFKREDFDAIYAIGADAETTRYMGGAVEDRALAWEKFLRGTGFWAVLGYGLWVAERKSDGTVLGQIGYGDFMRNIDPPLADISEMAWVLGNAARDSSGKGLGYGSEALSAVLAWGAAHLSAARVQCIISPENIPSLRLAKRHGFVEVRTGEYKGDRTMVLERGVR